MKKDCTGKYTIPFTSYVYNCYAYGHKANECRKPRYNNNRMYVSTNPTNIRPIG